MSHGVPLAAALSLVLLGSACSVGSGAAVIGPSPSFASVLDSLVPAAIARAGAPGAVVALVEHGRVRMSRGYGMADRATGRPMTDSTPIGVASVSKLVSTWGLMTLVARGALTLDAPIDRAITGWTLPPSAYDRRGVTMRRLLSHTAGTSMLSVPCFSADSTRPDEIAVLDGRAGDRGRVELARAPGSAWSYSGGGFTMLQLAASQVAKMPFDAFMQAAVLGPLGMRDSYFGPPRTFAATAYDDGGKPLGPTQCVGEAAAGLVTSARDIARLLLEYGRVRRGASALLPAPWLDTLSLPIIATSFVVDGKALDMGDTQMGLGHFVHVARGGRRMLFHSGGNPGVGAYLLVDLDRDGGLFVAVNSDNARDVMQAVLTAWGAWNDTDPPTFF